MLFTSGSYLNLSGRCFLRLLATGVKVATGVLFLLFASYYFYAYGIPGS